MPQGIYQTAIKIKIKIKIKYLIRNYNLMIIALIFLKNQKKYIKIILVHQEWTKTIYKIKVLTRNHLWKKALEEEHQVKYKIKQAIKCLLKSEEEDSIKVHLILLVWIVIKVSIIKVDHQIDFKI